MLLLKVNNSKKYRFIFPFAPFGAIALILISILFNYVDIDIDDNILYALSFGIGLFFSEVFYYYKKDELFFYDTKIEVLRGGKVKNLFLYTEMIEIRESSDYTMGGGPGMQIISYVEIDLGSQNVEKLFFEGFLQKRNIRKCLNVMRRYGVKVTSTSTPPAK